jgi:integrase
MAHPAFARRNKSRSIRESL